MPAVPFQSGMHLPKSDSVPIPAHAISSGLIRSLYAGSPVSMKYAIAINPSDSLRSRYRLSRLLSTVRVLLEKLVMKIIMQEFHCHTIPVPGIQVKLSFQPDLSIYSTFSNAVCHASSYRHSNPHSLPESDAEAFTDHIHIFIPYLPP